MATDTQSVPTITALGIARGGRRAGRRGAGWSRYSWIAFVLPGLALFTVFELYPLGRTFMLSLYDWDGFTDPSFVGGKNFRRTFGDEVFWKAARNSGVYAVGTTILKVVLGLAIATVVDRAVRGRAIYRSIVFAPALMSFVAVGLLWTMLYNPALGPVATMLEPLGLIDENLGILGDPGRALFAVMLVDVWKWVGYHAILFVAGFSLVRPELIEAAFIDGAGAWRRFWHVTLPGIRSVVVINVVIALAGALNSFDLVFVMTKGGPFRSSELMLTYMYSTAFTQNRFGLASAIACILFVSVGLLTLAVLGIGRDDGDGA